MSALRTLLTAPARFGRAAWRFVDPDLKAGRIPYARTVLVLQLIAALVFAGYTLAKKDIRMPFSPDPYMVEVAFVDAAGLDPSKEPGASVAGAQVGKVVEVRYEGGQAIATLRLDPELEGRIFADASASLRPLNVLQVLNVNIHPGSPEAGELPDGEVIAADRSDTFVAIDKLTSVLDADTQAQVRVLISEAATALDGREPELRRILAKLGRLTDTARPLARALDERRRLARKLVDHLDVIFTTLGRRRTQLAEAIDAGSRTLAVTAGREPELTAATRELAPTLLEAQRSLAAGRALADPLVLALDELNPAAPSLRPAATELRELIPVANRFLDSGELLVERARLPLRLFEQGTRGLATRVRRDLIPAIDNFGVTIDALDKFKGGIAQTADLWSHGFSTNANGGTYTQVYFGNSEFTPEGFGFPSSASMTARDEGPSRMAVSLAAAFEKTCREQNAIACQYRFSFPGLPPESVLARDGSIRFGGGG